MTNLIPSAIEQSLVAFDPSTQFFAIDKTVTGPSRFVVLDREDFSCWHFFLKIIFNCGKLRKFDICLKDISKFLSKFDFKEMMNATNAGTVDRNSTSYKAYIVTCNLANKAIYKNCFDLFNKVSGHTSMTALIQIYSRGGDVYRLRETRNAPIVAFWNPTLSSNGVAYTIPGANGGGVATLPSRDNYPNTAALSLVTAGLNRYY